MANNHLQVNRMLHKLPETAPGQSGKTTPLRQPVITTPCVKCYRTVLAV